MRNVFISSQINVKNVEDLDVIHEELLGVPLLLRVWAQHQQHSSFTGEQSADAPRWESKCYQNAITTPHPIPCYINECRIYIRLCFV